MALSDTDTNAAATFNNEFLSKVDGGTVASAATFSAGATFSAAITGTSADFSSSLAAASLKLDRDDDTIAEADKITDSDYKEGISFHMIDTNNTTWTDAISAVGAHNGAFIVTFKGKDGFAEDWIGFQIYCPLYTTSTHLLIRWCNEGSGEGSDWGSWFDFADI